MTSSMIWTSYDWWIFSATFLLRYMPLAINIMRGHGPSNKMCPQLED